MSSSRARKYTPLYGTSCQCRPACKSCPYTQRFRYNVGQQAHWSWINTTNEPHALRLRSFYHRIDAVNLGGQIRELQFLWCSF
jgi:hypothetical protein